MILLLAEGLTAPDVARRLGTTRTTVRRWRRHWLTRPGCAVPERLQDAPRPGAPATFSAEQWCQIIALAVSPRRRQGGLSAIGRRANSRMRPANAALSGPSPRAMSRVFYNQADLKPHQSRYGLNAEPDALADVKMADLTTLYGQAPALVEVGERVLSTDEMTGIQALERKHPTRLMEPGQAERREFEYPAWHRDVDRQFRRRAGHNRDAVDGTDTSQKRTL